MEEEDFKKLISGSKLKPGVGEDSQMMIMKALGVGFKTINKGITRMEEKTE